MDSSHILIHPKDNVAVALRSLNAGDVVCVDGHTIEVKSHIPMRHKFAVKPIARGEAAINPDPKFGISPRRKERQD